MKKRLIATAMGLLLVTSVYAEENRFDVDSLIGIEGGIASFDVERSQSGVAGTTDSFNKGELGLKVGAQTKDYRAFLGIHNYFVSEFDYFVTYGAEFEYLLNFSKDVNFFIGINGGIINAKFAVSAESESRTISDGYYGGDIGFNYHLSDMFDLEVGTRLMATNAKNIKNGVAYKFDNILTGYTSLIYKFHLD